MLAASLIASSLRIPCSIAHITSLMMFSIFFPSRPVALLFPAGCVIVEAARWQALTASVWVLDSRLLVQGWAAIFFYCFGMASRIMRAASCASLAVASTSLARVSR